MWTRGELKSRAKSGLKQYYWYGVLAAFVAGLLGGNAGSGGVQISLPARGYTSSIEEEFYYGDMAFNIGVILVALAVTLVIALIGWAFACFVSNVIWVGKCRYFTMSTMEQRNVGIEELFGGFKRGCYLNVVKVQFFRGLFEWLWSLCFIIPGVIKHYEYYMVPYLVAEYPQMDRKEIFRLSKVMMDGNKFDTWVLEISFIGWDILGALACCIGGFFVRPYKEATYAELYLKLREERLGLARGGITGGDGPVPGGSGPIPQSQATSWQMDQNGNWYNSNPYDDSYR